jgi:hypothetical protein
MQPLDVIEHHGQLVGVEIRKHRSGPHHPRAAAAPRRFDLDHLGAEVGQQFPAVLAGDRVG